MDGYQALPESQERDNLASQLMGNLNIASENPDLVQLIVDGDINTEDKIMSK